MNKILTSHSSWFVNVSFHKWDKHFYHCQHIYLYSFNKLHVQFHKQSIYQHAISIHESFICMEGNNYQQIYKMNDPWRTRNLSQTIEMVFCIKKNRYGMVSHKGKTKTGTKTLVTMYMYYNRSSYTVILGMGSCMWESLKLWKITWLYQKS